MAAMLEHLDQPPGQGSVTRSGVYSLTSLTVPTWPAQGTSLSASKLSGREVPVGPEQISVCQTLLSVFSQNDAAFGAGSVLEPLRRFLATSVTDWLRAPAEPRFRRELCTATAQMAYLCAFAHFDSNLHPQAQQYYLASLSLAHEGGDRAGYAVGLRGLSVQAHALGHFQHADRLATQAVHLGIPHASPPQQAFLLGQLAVTRAVAGDLRASNHHLSAAEQRLESAHSAWAPVGAYHPASLALQHATVARGLHDHQRAVRELQLSLRYRPEGENRSRAITLAHLAEAQLSLGHLDLACHTWAEFLALYPQIASARADDLLKSQVASLRPHRRNRTAGSLLEQALYLRQLRYRS
ncbi:hypothetical protein [Streptomyces violascens]|uniref:hypothetical protein n=1 Tax=Streptomyces violascens TaxID=67381 RepID=UPI0016746DF9|nr:hypothetical protein [Streptomyces violascens]